MRIDGISDELMISYVRSRGHAYQLTAEQVIRLKDGGVNDVVVKALMGDNVASPAPQPSRTQVATVPASLSIRPEATAQPEPVCRKRLASTLSNAESGSKCFQRS
jgi:hypothetical protein